MVEHLDMVEGDGVVLDATVAARLVEYALGELWWADREGGCCPLCCSGCAALKQLLDEGRLDETVRPRAFRSGWWDESTGRVGREWLTRCWRRTSCHR